uniref:Uncharacterized protein n=1 Tax=Anguilla anguilla TaxID=7936 RepID=A0A0E9X5L3_ANGAN
MPEFVHSCVIYVYWREKQCIQLGGATASLTTSSGWFSITQQWPFKIKALKLLQLQ